MPNITDRRAYSAARQLQALTNRNNHCEAALVLADLLSLHGLEDYMPRAQALKRLQRAQGHLTADQSDAYYALLTEMWGAIAELTTDAGYAAIYGAM